MEKDYKQTYQGYDPNSPESDIMFEFVQDKNMENSIELAKYMQKYVCQATGRQDLGAQQDNLAVLRLSSMPSCLLELGFISTRDEENYMNSAAAEIQYAKGIFNAFLNYRKRHGGSITIPYQTVTPPKAEEKPVPETEPEPEGQKVLEMPSIEPMPVEKKEKITASPQQSVTDVPVFKVQILTSDRKLSSKDTRLKGLDSVGYYQEGGIYKYTVGDSENYNEIYRLRKEVLGKFPQAFIIAFKNGVKTDVQAAIQEYKRNKSRK